MPAHSFFSDDALTCSDADLQPALRALLDAPDPLLDPVELPGPLPFSFETPRRRGGGPQGAPALACRGPGLVGASGRTRSPRPRTLATALALLVLPALVCACGDEDDRAQAPDSVLVQLRDGRLPAWRTPDDGAGAPVEALHQLGPEEEPPLLRMPVPAGRAPGELCSELADDPAVELCEPVALVQPSRTPDDPRFKELWGLAKIGAPAAWARTTFDRAVTVAVVDDGIALDHPDLKANLWVNPGESPGNGRDDDGDGFVDDVHGWDFVDGRPDGAAVSAGEAPWHGSHVAGTIGAAGDNRVGVAGVSWKVSLMALRALGPSGGRSDDLARAIDYAAAHGARVINASWGGGGQSQVIARAIERAGRKGALFVAAAGNDAASRPGFPASLALPGLLSVGATDSADALAPFSDRGALVAAPGVGILSTTAPGRYERYDGTSMAAPHVSGTAALLWAAHPKATLAQVRAAILGSATPVSGVRHGRVDAAAALAALDGALGGSAGEVPALHVSRGALSFTASGGEAPRAQVISVRDAAGAQETVRASADRAWVELGRSQGTTPLRLSVRANPKGLREGTHQATLTLDAGGGAAAQVALTLRVGASLAPAGPAAEGACAARDGAVHVAAGSLCALTAPGLEDDPGARDVRWALPGGGAAAGARLVARFPRRGRFTLRADGGAGAREVPVVVE